MPKPKAGESEKDYMGRCMSWPDLQDREQEQRAAICHSMFRQKNRSLLSIYNDARIGELSGNPMIGSYASGLQQGELDTSLPPNLGASDKIGNAAEKKCPHCGAEVDEDEDECPECGMDIEEEEAKNRRHSLIDILNASAESYERSGDGYFTHCMESGMCDDADDEEACCAAVHEKNLGRWPSEDKIKNRRVRHPFLVNDHGVNQLRDMASQAVSADPRFQGQGQGLYPASPTGWVTDLIEPDEGSPGWYAVVRMPDGNLVKIGFEVTDEGVMLSEGDPEPTQQVYNRVRWGVLNQGTRAGWATRKGNAADEADYAAKRAAAKAASQKAENATADGKDFDGYSSHGDAVKAHREAAKRARELGKEDEAKEHDLTAKDHDEKRMAHFKKVANRDRIYGPHPMLVVNRATIEVDGKVLENFALPKDGWSHIVPVGEFDHGETGLKQVLDKDALGNIAQTFAEEKKAKNFGGVRVDFDHMSYDAHKPSRAAGWIMDLDNREDGLWAKVEWSKSGKDAVEGGDYRYVSPVWRLSDCEHLDNERVRPKRLDSVGLTNNPNLRGMCPISNSATERKEPARVGVVGYGVERKGKVSISPGKVPSGKRTRRMTRAEHPSEPKRKECSCQ